MTKKIIIIGSYPPPYGGISVHLERVLLYLNRDEYVFYNEQKSKHPYARPFYNKSKFIKVFLFLFKRFKLIHYHTPNNKIRIMLCLIGLFRKNIYLHIHGESIRDAIENNFFNYLFYKYFLRFVGILADNEKIAGYLKSFKPGKIRVIDAFIPPKFDVKIYQNFKDKYPMLNDHILISHVGWFSLYNKEDLYGYDLVLETLRILTGDYHLHVSIISSVNGIKDWDLYHHFLRKRKQYHLDDKFKLILENVNQIWPLFLISAIFIRPTNTDGHSMSLSEALWFECIALASDVIPRPENVILFQNRNAKDLAVKVAQIIKSQKFLSLDNKISLIKNKKYNYKLFEEIYGIER